jgi:hypothetical protein
MADIVTPVAAPGQRTPSLFKSGKPGFKSMLALENLGFQFSFDFRSSHQRCREYSRTSKSERWRVFKREPALGLDSGVATGSRREKCVETKDRSLGFDFHQDRGSSDGAKRLPRKCGHPLD